MSKQKHPARCFLLYLFRPITLLSTHILDRPSSFNQPSEYLDELKDKLKSDHSLTSQHLLVRRIPVNLVQRLLRTMKLLKEYVQQFFIVSTRSCTRSCRTTTMRKSAGNLISGSTVPLVTWIELTEPRLLVWRGRAINWSLMQQRSRRCVFPWSSCCWGICILALSGVRGWTIGVSLSITNRCPLVVRQLTPSNPACDSYLR